MSTTVFSEAHVHRLATELEHAKATIESLEAERAASDNWSSISAAKQLAHKAQQDVVQLAAELERERQEKAPGRRELNQLKSDLEYAQERVRLLEAELATAKGKPADAEAR